MCVSLNADVVGRHFAAYGRIERIQLPLDSSTGKGTTPDDSCRFGASSDLLNLTLLSD